MVVTYSYVHAELWWKVLITSLHNLTTTLNRLNSLMVSVLWPCLNFWDHKFYNKKLYNSLKRLTKEIFLHNQRCWCNTFKSRSIIKASLGVLYHVFIYQYYGKNLVIKNSIFLTICSLHIDMAKNGSSGVGVLVQK